jgi:hypothetical protein
MFANRNQPARSQEDEEDAAVAAANRFLSPMDVELARKALAAVKAAREVARLRTEEAEQKIEEIRILRRRADLVRTAGLVESDCIFFLLSFLSLQFSSPLVFALTASICACTTVSPITNQICIS